MHSLQYGIFSRVNCLAYIPQHLNLILGFYSLLYGVGVLVKKKHKKIKKKKKTC